jgi:hypothetical protein
MNQDLQDQLDDMTEKRDHLRVALKDAEARAEAAEGAIWQLPCSGAHCVPNDEHQRVVEECAALSDKLKESHRTAALYEQDAIQSRAKLDALSAFIRGGIIAITRG